MSKRDSFLLRIDPTVLEDLKRWAEADLRSTNAHIEFLLRKCVIEHRKQSKPSLPDEDSANSSKSSESPEQ